MITFNTTRSRDTLRRFFLPLLFSVMCIPPATAATHSTGAPLKDDKITKNIEDKMLFAKGGVLDDIEAVTLNGMLTLIGKASTLLEKERVASIAKTVGGVRTVINRIAVSPQLGRTDRQIQEDANRALTYDPAKEDIS